jgi:hypothetical protein
MLRVGLVVLFACAAGIAVAAVPRPPADTIVRGVVDFVPADDPFPIRRVRGNDERLPELLKELESGPTIRLPRLEFESRVRVAGRAVSQAKQAARVVDAVYYADLENGDLSGTAELGILNARGVVGFAPLEPLRLAVRDVKWAKGSDATIANGNAPAVWVERDGRSVLTFVWSLAGTTEPGERRFEMRVPNCATSTLELKLPTDQVPTASADVLLTGPFEVAGQPAKRAWRLRFGGRAKLEFAVRASGTTIASSSAVLAARYDLTLGQLTASFEYDLRPARGSVGEWVFLADASLRITDVVANNRAGWIVEPAVVAGGPRRVRVSLRQPGPGGKIQITAIAPFPDSTRPPESPLPAVRPLGAVIENESVEVRIAPNFKIESWNAGDYRLTETATALDQNRVLTLVGTLLAPGSDDTFRRMPTVRTATLDAEFTSFERLQWRLSASGSSLVARVAIRVQRGPLFQLAIRPPPGYTLARTTSLNEDLLTHTNPANAGTQVIDFARPLLAGQLTELRLELRGPSAKVNENVPFPAFAVVGAVAREGWLSVASDSSHTAAAKPGAGATPAGLWGWLTTDSPKDATAVYLFRAREPEGFARLVPVQPQFRAATTTRFDWHSEILTATTQHALTITGGELTSLTMFVPGAHIAERKWHLGSPANTAIEAMPVPAELLQMLSLLSPRDQMAASVATSAKARGDGTYWLLRFAQPQRGEVLIETTAPLARLSENAVLVPVPRIRGRKDKASVVLSPTAKTHVTAEPQGDWLQVRSLARPAIADTPISNAYLLTAVRSPTEVIVAFGGTLRDSPGGTLPIMLPPGSRVRSVCVNGKWVNPASCEVRDSQEAIAVLLPRGLGVRFEVRYALPPARGWPTRSVTSATPQVASQPQVTRWWAFASGTRPGWPSRPWEATRDEPPLLGGPLIHNEPAFVIRSDDEWVRVGAERTADSIAIVFSAALLVYGWLAWCRNRKRPALVLCAVTSLAFAAAQIGPPWWVRVAWPVFCVSALSLAALLIRLGLAQRHVPRLVPAATAIACVSVWYSLHAVAQQSAIATVLIVSNAEGEEDVIAPVALMDKLSATAKPALPAPVIAAAAYEIRVDDGIAKVTAKFTARAFRASDNAVSIPLSDVRLERATVNGAPAFPAVSKPDTYTIALPNAGQHEIELRFVTSATATGSEREVRFGIPEVPNSRTSFSLPNTARQPQIATRMGKQTTGTASDRVTLDAELGAVKFAHLRWREGAGGATAIKVREGCIWDVTEAGAELHAGYFVRVEQGTLTGLRFNVPAELEVLRVAARSTETPATPLAIRDWTLSAEKDGLRTLRVDFQSPVAGRFAVVLECGTRKPLTRQPVLRFPRVAFTNTTGEAESVYGLRTTRLAIDEVPRSGVIDFPADSLREFVTLLDLKLEPNNPLRAFRLAPNSVAELRPTLRVAELPAVRVSTTWQLGPHRADATSSVAWTSREPVSFLEFTLTGARVLELRGADVANWTQSGARVQVWLRSSVKDSSFEWIATAIPAPTGKPPPNPLPLELPQPKFANSRFTTDEVRVQTIAGWSAIADRVRGWQSVPSGGEMVFRTDSASAAPVRVVLSPNK